MLKILQYLLLPLSFAYQLVLRFRNFLYDHKIIAPSEFDIPTLVLGNLAFGGTGKTPHTEYLIQLLGSNHKIGVLSRGYGRRSNGYFFAHEDTDALILGDEPYQLYLAHKNIAVGVCENRVLGIPHLLFDAPETDLVILDDAYQHRPLKGDVNILLSDYARPYYSDFLVPSGYLREYRSAATRAQIIIISKCPADLSRAEADGIIARIKPHSGQKVFFSTLSYGEPIGIFTQEPLRKNSSLLAFASIANPKLFLTYLQSNYPTVKHKWYPDHHLLKPRELLDLKERFELLEGSNKAIITTAKDHSKLLSLDLSEEMKALPWYYLPIGVRLLFNEEAQLLSEIEKRIEAKKATYQGNT